MNIQENYKSDFSQGEPTPLDDAIEVHFFPGGRRKDILDELLTAISSAVPIITLTGDEGSGKTMMCRMVEKNVPPGYVIVFFPQTVDSFEDVARIAATRLGVEPAIAAGDIPHLLSAIAVVLSERGQRMLLIFDEAERIYLATLERVRKMLDQLNASGPLLQIILSGRSGLHKNFKNLALCNFMEVEERHIALEPLTREETFAYLRHVTEHDKHWERDAISSAEAEKIYTASAGNFKLIKTQTRDVSPSPVPDDSFLVLLDNVQEKEIIKKAPRKRIKPAARMKRPLGRRHLAWGGGILCLLVAVFFLTRPGQKPESASVENLPGVEGKIVIAQPEAGEQLPEKTPAAPVVQSETKTAAEQPVPTVETASKVQEEKEEVAEKVTPPQPVNNPVVEQKMESPAVQVTPEPPVEKIQESPVVKNETPTPAKPEKEAVVGPSVEAGQALQTAGEKRDLPATGVSAESKNEENASPVVVMQPVQPEKKEPATEEKQIAPEPKTVETVQNIPPAMPVEATVEQEAAPVTTIKAKEIVKYRERMLANAVTETERDVPVRQVVEQEESRIAKIELTKPAKIRPEMVVESKEKPIQVESGGGRKQEAVPVVKAVPEKIQKPADTPQKASVKKNENGDRLYSRRVTAGTSWLLGLKDDHYTVQLMVISDREDEKKLKAMLAGDGMRGQADKIYILRNETSPDIQYVFYGEYPSMTDARNARNSLPESLRGTKPYAMSVKGAVQKVQQED